MQGREVICQRCRKPVPAISVRFLPKGNDSYIVLCQECIKNEHQKKPVVKQKKERKDYFCSRCRYKFKFSDDGVTVLRCPYCGKADKVEKHPKMLAEDWLRSSE